MTYTTDEKNTLEKVNQIGCELETNPEVENIVFITLSPYLGSLMSLLKRLDADAMTSLFVQYPGIRAVMVMIEDGAQAMEQSLRSR